MGGMESFEALQKSISDDITSNVTSDVTDTISETVTNQLYDMFSWIIMPAIILVVLLIAVQAYRMFRHYRLEKAIFEIRDTLREMKKSQSNGMPTPPSVSAGTVTEPAPVSNPSQPD